MAERLSSAVRLYVFAGLGIFLLVAPWTPVWDQATLSLFPVAVGSWMRSGWIRGLVSGVGLLDLIVAAVEGHALWRLMRGAGH